jgi:uncharacterized protein
MSTSPAVHLTPSTRRRHWTCALSAVLTGILVTYVAVSGYVANSLTRTVRREFAHFPEQYDLISESVRFLSRTDGLTLDGWLLAPDSAVPPRRPVVIVHGQDQDRESEIDGRVLEVAAALARAGRPVLVFDSRGYGYSAGDRFTLGAKETGDLRGAIDELERRGLTGSGVDLLGYSMGGATALMLTPSEPRVRAVAEDSGYAVLAEVLQQELPSHSGLPGIFTPGTVFMARFVADVDLDAIRPLDTVHRLAEHGVPLLVIHSDADALIPISHGHRLAATYGPRVQTYFVSGAQHVQSYLLDPATYLARLTQFFDRAE